MLFRIAPWPAIFLLAIAAFIPFSSFSKSDPNLSVLLNDAAYSLNRYEELITAIHCEGWKAPEDLRHSCAAEMRLINANVKTTKIAILRAMKARSPSVVDLLDIYNELEETAGYLEELANDVSNYQGEDGIALSQAAAKTLVLGAHFYVQVRQRLLLEEKRCQER